MAVRDVMRFLRLPVAGLLLLTGAGFGCKGEKALLDDRNPFYLRGLRLRQDNQYEEAAAAFETCLRFSPNSAKADLQLAMLYEDHLGDPFRAIYHYREYLHKARTGDNTDLAKKWLSRAERTALQQLMDRYPEDVDILLGKNQPVDVTSSLTPRERFLLERLKRMTAELLRLRGALDKSGTVLPAPAPVPAPGLPPAGTGGRSALGPAVPPPSGHRVEGSGERLLPPAPAMVEPPETADGPEPEPVSDTPGAGIGPAPMPAPAPVPAPVPVPAPLPVPGSAEVVATGSRTPAPVPPPDGADARTGGVPPAAPGAGVAAVAPPTGERSFIPIRRLTPGATGAGERVAGGAPAPAAAAASTTYTVQRGDTLSSIARKVYGSAGRWTAIRDANPDLRDGRALKAGMKLRLPPRTGSSRPP